MSEIKRYDVWGNCEIHEDECENGYYVSYSSHQAAIQQAKIDAVRKFVEYTVKSSPKTIGQCSASGAYQVIEVDNMKADAERYIEQLKEQGE